MTKLQKRITIIICLIGIVPIYLISKDTKDEQTSREKEIKNDTEDILDTLIDGNTKVEKIYNIVKKQKKGKTTINSKIISYGKNTTNTNIENQVNNTFISKNYFNEYSNCSTSCGIAIKGWKDAKKFCIVQNKSLPSTKQIFNSYRYSKKECRGCSFWTINEALHPTLKTSYPRRRVKVYVQSDRDFSNYSSTSTYVATCVAR